jgi:DNA sulfur modification protein DndD
MKITNITLHNVGVFKGEHSFDLTPIISSAPTARSIMVINGHNGAGKSTLFRAIALALHGSQSPLELENGQPYEELLHSLVHRSSVNGPSSALSDASIRLQFEYVRSGEKVEISVERTWKPRGVGEQETLHVLCNGSQPDIEPSHYQTWINDHISPDVIPLCCFDAEQLDALSSPDQYNKQLGGLVRRIFGLDAVERLYGDLRLITLRQSRESDQHHQTADAVLRHQAEIDTLEAHLNACQSNLQALELRQAELQEALNQSKGHLAAEGGEYAAKRPLIEERLNTTNHELEQIASELRELSNGLLPFALAPELCGMLDRRLQSESQLRQTGLSDLAWKERISKVKHNLENENFWEGLKLDTGQRKELCRRVEHLLRDVLPPTNHNQQQIIHQLSGSAQVEIQTWLKQATAAIPSQAETLNQRSRQLRLERQNLEMELRRAPDEAILQPIHEEIVRLEVEWKKIEDEQSAINQELGAAKFRLAEQERLYKKAEDEMRTLNSRHRQLELAEKSKQALLAYQDALTRQRTQELEQELVNAFNLICNKTRLILDAHIDPRNFKVELKDVNHHIVRLDDLSAGERHLYVLALLWALRKVSKLELPLLIDTPLARLDEQHRDKIIHTYFPQVSKQVVLFTTDAEMSNRLMEEIRPYLAHVYRLQFDPQHGETVVN